MEVANVLLSVADFWHDLQHGALLCNKKLTRCDLKILHHENCNREFSC